MFTEGSLATKNSASVFSMMPMAQSIFFDYEGDIDKNGVGREQEREKERVRETD